MTTKTEMTAAHNTAVAMPSYVSKSCRGSENVDTSDLQIPRIGIVQALSPERKKNDPAYIEGAEEGHMFNSVTRELFKDPLLVIPVYYRKEFFLWRVRAQGGGFRGVYQTYGDAQAAQLEVQDKTEINDTAQQFCLVSSDNGATWSEAVVSMTSSNGGVSKRWNSDIKLRGADRFANVYQLSVVEKSNDKGSFFIFKENWVRWATEPEYRSGEQSYEAIRQGARDVSRDYDNVPVTTATADGEAGNDLF